MDLRSELQRASATLMGAAPLLPVALGFLIGPILDDAVQPALALYAGVFALSAAAVSLPGLRRTGGPLLTLIASASVGGMLHWNAVRAVPANSIARYTSAQDVLVRLQGRVVTEPRVVGPPTVWFSPWSFGADRSVFLLDLEDLQGVDGPIGVSGRIRVTAAEPVPDLRADDRVDLLGWLHRFEPPANLGGFDHATYFRRQGIVAGVRCQHRENIKLLDAAAPPRTQSLAWFRGAVRRLLIDDRSTASADEQGLLEALILGHRSQSNRELDDAFTRAGCVHFLAASGTNIVIVMFLARLLCPGFLFRPRTRVLAMLLATVLYAMLAEPRPPILRAAVICSVYCLARLLGRHRARLNWISASVIVLALIDPAMDFDVGYQLSYAATLGVSFLTQTLRTADRELRTGWTTTFVRNPLTDDDRRITDAYAATARGPRHLWWATRRALRRIVEGPPEVSIGAWLGTLPIVAAHFQRIQFWGPISTLVLLPLVTAAMGLGFLKVVLTLVSPSLGALVTPLLQLVNEAVLATVNVLADLPGASVAVPAPPWWVMATYSAFLLACLWRFREPTDMLSSERRRLHSHPIRDPDVAAGRVLKIGTLVLLASFGLWAWRLQPADRLVVTVLAVGAGSATVIELPDGRTVVYDAGSNRPHDVGAGVVAPHLRRRGIRRVEQAYVSHPNLDHYNGFPGLIDEIPVGEVVLNRHFPRRRAERPPVREFLQVLRREGQDVRLLNQTGETSWDMGGVRFELLWPPDDLPLSVPANDTSTVLRLTYHGRSILLPGDIEHFAQQTLLDRGGMSADVLILPHHGGLVPNSATFFQAVGPVIAIRSSHLGADSDESLRFTLGPAVRLYHTADVGAVQVVLDADGISCSTARLPP